MVDKQSMITLQWSEPLEKLGISDDMVEASLLRGVRSFLLDNPEWVRIIHQAIEKAQSLLSEDDLAKALKDDMLTVLKSRVAEQRAELQKCLADYRGWHAQHASDYAHRRYLELHEKLDKMDRG